MNILDEIYATDRTNCNKDTTIVYWQLMHLINRLSGIQNRIPYQYAFPIHMNSGTARLKKNSKSQFFDNKMQRK